MKKIGLIAIIVVLALGIIGVGYAAWSQVLNINGNVTTATSPQPLAQMVVLRHLWVTQLLFTVQYCY